jgi:hypothetical protein
MTAKATSALKVLQGNHEAVAGAAEAINSTIGRHIEWSHCRPDRRLHLS